MPHFIDNITQAIGNTPLLQLNKVKQAYHLQNDLFAKLEFLNPFGSVKDRIALALIQGAEKKNKCNSETVFIEATSGNTGIAVAAMAHAKGYKTIIVMPESMSAERQKAIKYFGATLILTPAKDGMTGAYRKAQTLAKENKNYIWLNQFSNPDNVQSHYETSAVEIWHDLDEKVDLFVSGIGSGGSITGIGKFLKEKNKDAQVIAVEPENCPLLSKGEKGSHKIQGIGDEFIPEILDIKLLDRIIPVSDQDAFEQAKKLYTLESIPAGISSGACLKAILDIDKDYQNKNIVFIIADSAFRYLSTELC